VNDIEGFQRKVREAEASLTAHNLMSFLAIDLGFNTGLAYVIYDFDAGDIVYRLLQTILRMETRDILHLLMKTDVVILEKMPKKMERELSASYGEITGFLERIGMSPIMIMPAEWKPIAKARKWSARKASTQHEKDAYCMMRYHIFVKYKVDIGELK